jgi:hypothetical protein
MADILTRVGGPTEGLISNVEQPVPQQESAGAATSPDRVDPRQHKLAPDDPDARRGRQWRPAATCCVLYVLLAVVAFGTSNSLGSGQLAGQRSPDVVEQIWWLAWTAFALPHGHNVLSAQWQNYPAGENFGANGSMLALGILFAPITKLFGPVVSWNIAVRLALAASACSMCLVLRRWTTWWPAAFVGGLLYGFSAYALSFGADLLFLTFVPFPPIMFLVLHEIVVRQRWRASRAGVLLGVLCVLQFFIWSEVLASTVVIGVIAVVLFLLVNRHDLVTRWRYMATALAYGLGVAGILLILPLGYTLFGPQSIRGTPVSPTSLAKYPSDLFGALVPNSQWLTTNGLTSLAKTRFPDADDLYVGIPMILVLSAFAIFLRKRRTILFAGVMALVSLVISLGPHLRIDGHETPIPLPFAALEHLPLLQGFVPSRFALYTDLFAAAMFAIGLDEIFLRLTRADVTRGRSMRWQIAAAVGVATALTAAVVLPLLPGHAEPTTRAGVPHFFTSASVDSIPEGGVVLAYPYPDFSGSSLFYEPTHDIMLDQAVSGMRFKLIGGYGWFPSPTGVHGTTSPSVLQPSLVQEFFDSAYWGRSEPKGNLVDDLRLFLRRFDVQSVVVLHEGANPAEVISEVATAIGCPVDFGGVMVWSHVAQQLKSDQFHPVDKPATSCVSIPKVVTTMVRPANGAIVAGTTVLGSSVRSYSPVTRVSFLITGGSEHDVPIATARLTPVGWLAEWNSSTVPNGTYTLRSVASDSQGESGSGAGITITVKN